MNAISYTWKGLGTLTLLGQDVCSTDGPNPTFFYFNSEGKAYEHTSHCLEVALSAVFTNHTYLVRSVIDSYNGHIYLVEGEVRGLIRNPRKVLKNLMSQLARAFGREWMGLDPTHCWSCHQELPESHGISCPKCEIYLIFA